MFVTNSSVCKGAAQLTKEFTRIHNVGIGKNSRKKSGMWDERKKVYCIKRMRMYEWTRDGVNMQKSLIL